MKRKSKQTSPIVHTNQNFDLFGEISVTWDEVYLWCEVITRGKYSKANRNLIQYVEGWNVIGKIKAVKRDYLTLDDYFIASANDARY